jgi:hypothetical protein
LPRFIPSPLNLAMALSSLWPDYDSDYSIIYLSLEFNMAKGL